MTRNMNENVCLYVCVCEPSPIAIDPQREHRRPICALGRTPNGKQSMRLQSNHPGVLLALILGRQAGRRWYVDRESTVRSHLEWKYSTCRQRASTTAGWRTNTHTHSVRGFWHRRKIIHRFPCRGMQDEPF